MEYTKKYPTAKPLEICRHGILLKGETEGPCTISGRLTAFADVCYEAHICSDECMQRMDKDMTEACR